MERGRKEIEEGREWRQERGSRYGRKSKTQEDRMISNKGIGGERRNRAKAGTKGVTRHGKRREEKEDRKRGGKG